MKLSEAISQPLAMRTDDYIGMGPAHVDGNDAWRLICACVDGDMEVAASLLDRAPELANVQYWYQTPLHFAARQGHADVASLLLGYGADPTTSCYGADEWAVMLETARLRGHTGMETLLAKQMRERFGYTPDFTPLAAAIRAYDTGRLGRILDDQPDLLHAADGTGNGALHWAAMTHQPELFAVLRDRGIDLDRRRADGRSALLLAVHGDYAFRWWRDVPEQRRRPPAEIIGALLDAGANRPLAIAILQGDRRAVEAELCAHPGAANKLDAGRTSPLCYASLGGQPDITELLLAHGADPDQPEALAPYGRALYEAAARNNLAQARLLLAAGADPDAAIDSSGNCLYAVESRHPDDCAAMQELLFAHGARKASWQMDDTELRAALLADEPLHDEENLWTDVIATGDLDLLELLIERSPEAPALLDGWIFRPGSPAVVGTTFMLARLIEASFDIRRPDWQGATLLHYCVAHNNAKMAADLVRRGADINATELTHGGTPLASAARRGRTEMVEFLLAAGADPDAPPEHEWARPTAQARRAGHSGIVELLRRR